MDRDFQIQRLYDLVQGEWGTYSISIHNRITDIRALLAYLGADYLQLDPIAVEIETISGTALGMGDSIFTEVDLRALIEQVEKLRKQFYLISKSSSASDFK